MITLGAFIQMLFANPILVIIMVIVIGATVVNGASAAPNAVATLVGTRSVKPQTAIILAAICSVVGLFVISLFNTAVAQTILSMVDFGGDTHYALLGLCAGAVAIIVWCTASWWFGIPTSNSHALMAGITGAGVAITGFAGINGHAWLLILLGLVISSILGFGCGWILARLTKLILRGLKRSHADRGFRIVQILFGTVVSLLHGSQDGQKFLSIAFMGIILASGGSLAQVGGASMPIWLILLIGIAMGLGTAVGGRRIIKTVGMSIAKLETYQGALAMISASICIAFATFTGIPLSDVHTCNTSIVGVGAERNIKKVNWGVIKRMVLAWVITFPACGVLGFLMTKLFLLF